jgi:sugar-specific transcriptional regulator TrmB
MNKYNVKSTLLNLDFTPNDADVYLTLIKLGLATADAIIKETGLHRNLVYTSLNHLISKKLISEQIIHSKKNFSANNPQSLADDFSERAILAKEAVKEIEKSIPRDRQEISIHQGNDEYFKMQIGLINMLPKGATKHIMGTGGQAFMENTMIPFWKPYHKAALNQNLKIRMISYENQISSIKSLADETGIYETRYLPANTENPAGIHIYPEIDTVLNIIYSDDKHPVTAIKIKNKALTESYLKLFNNLWETAKEVR